MFTAEEILDMAIRIERNGEHTYREAIQKAANPKMESLLGWMADEEKQHAEFFLEIKEKLEISGGNPVADAFGHQILDKLLGNQRFSLEDVDFGKVEHVKDLIGVFIEFEEDTVLFYQMLESFLQDDRAQRELRRVIDEEKRHIRKLKDFLVNERELVPNGLPG
jgi:rubrerythrin